MLFFFFSELRPAFGTVGEWQSEANFHKSNSTSKECTAKPVFQTPRKKSEPGQIIYYNCSICGQAFNKKFNFKRHMKIHSKIKEFQCPYCMKQLSRKDHFKVHLSTHNILVSSV